MPYRDYRDHELSLSDMLAVDRTALANERTLLAYVRTTIMLGVSAISLIKLFPDSNSAVTAGICLIPVSFFVAGLGLRRYYGMFRPLLQMRNRRMKKHED